MNEPKCAMLAAAALTCVAILSEFLLRRREARKP
jgi:hypothetical protein